MTNTEVHNIPQPFDGPPTYVQWMDGFSVSVMVTPDEYWSFQELLWPFLEDEHPLEMGATRREDDNHILLEIESSGPRAFEIRDLVLAEIDEINAQG